MTVAQVFPLPRRNRRPTVVTSRTGASATATFSNGTKQPGQPLDAAAANASRPFNLRFAYIHLIEETARHLGHIDILREYLDGTTGE